MIDRRLVVTGLAALKQDYLMRKCGVNSAVIDRAIELLKEQEPSSNEKKNVVIEENNFTGLPVTRCAKCKKSVDRYLYGRHDEQVTYCPFCGQALEWELFAEIVDD